MTQPDKKPAFFIVRLLSVLLACFLWTGCANYPAPTESHFNRGVELYDQGKHALAIDQYKLALRKNPDDPFALYNLAVVYQDQGKHKEATRLYKKILENTEDTNSRINLAALYYDRGDRDLAFKELDTAAKKNRDSAEPLSVQGEYLEREGALEKATDNYIKALAIDDKHALTYFRLGRIYCKQEKPELCLEKLEQAALLAPKTPAYLEALATQNEKTNNNREAIHLLERASVLEPDRADILVRLGDLYKTKKLYQNALKRYWSAIAIKDDNPEVHQSLIEIYGWLGEMELQAMENLEDQNSLAKKPR
jgi:tetratricopeptide (TPR) repeat protein